MGIGGKIKGFLFSPTETFDASKEDTLRDAFKYYLLLLLFSAIPIAVIFAISPPAFLELLKFRGFGTLAIRGISLLLSLLYILLKVIGVVIGGLYLHIFVYILRGRKGLSQTIKANMYGETPYLLLSAISLYFGIFVTLLSKISDSQLLFIVFSLFLVVIIGLIGAGAFWSLIVGIIGIKQLHEISTARAILSVILAAIPVIVLLKIG